MKEKEIQDELSSIRSIMERSSKFISLSGLSGILAGVYALIGAGVAYQFIYTKISEIPADIDHIPTKAFFYDSDINAAILFLSAIALLVLIASIGTGIFLTIRKAKQKGQPIFGGTSRTLLFHMAVPLIAGGIFILLLTKNGYYGLVAPTSLVFYGVALVGASSFTFTMVKYLGLCEIALGLIAAFLPIDGLLFWAIGFGVLHIVYGSLMYFKYDR
jgi:hypothetical protein